MAFVRAHYFLAQTFASRRIGESFEDKTPREGLHWAQEFWGLLPVIDDLRERLELFLG